MTETSSGELKVWLLEDLCWRKAKIHTEEEEEEDEGYENQNMMRS